MTSQKGIANLSLILMLIAGVVIGVNLVQQTTNLTPKAQEISPTPPPTVSADCPEGVPFYGVQIGESDIENQSFCAKKTAETASNPLPDNSQCNLQCPDGKHCVILEGNPTCETNQEAPAQSAEDQQPPATIQPGVPDNAQTLANCNPSQFDPNSWTVEVDECRDTYTPNERRVVYTCKGERKVIETPNDPKCKIVEAPDNQTAEDQNIIQQVASTIGQGVEDALSFISREFQNNYQRVRDWLTSR